MKKIILSVVVVAVTFTACTSGPSSKKRDRASCKRIVEAAWHGKSDAVYSALANGVDPNCTHDRTSALLAAARKGDMRSTQLLVKSGANVHYKMTSSGKVATPTYVAAYRGHTKVAAYLVQQGGSMAEAKKGYQEYQARETGGLLALGLLAAGVSALASAASDGSSSSYSSYSSPSSSSSSSSSSYSSSSSKKSGVKEVYDGGYKSSQGFPIYKVKCYGGRSGSAYYDGGKWYDGSGYSYGSGYNGISSPNGFARVFCK